MFNIIIKALMFILSKIISILLSPIFLILNAFGIDLDSIFLKLNLGLSSFINPIYFVLSILRVPSALINLIGVQILGLMGLWMSISVVNLVIYIYNKVKP